MAKVIQQPQNLHILQLKSVFDAVVLRVANDSLMISATKWESTQTLNHYKNRTRKNGRHVLY